MGVPPPGVMGGYIRDGYHGPITDIFKVFISVSQPRSHIGKAHELDRSKRLSERKYKTFLQLNDMTRNLLITVKLKQLNIYTQKLAQRLFLFNYVSILRHLFI